MTDSLIREDVLVGRIEGFPSTVAAPDAVAYDFISASYAESQSIDNITKTDRYLLPLIRRIGAQTVLDAGCGVGATVERLCEHGIAAYGYDLIENVKFWVLQGRSTARYAVAAPVDPVLPFDNGVFDLLFSFGAIEHVGTDDGDNHRMPDYHEIRRRWTQEMLRVVRPGGHLFLAGPNRSFPVDTAHALDLSASKWEKALAARLRVSVHRIWGPNFLWGYPDVRRYLAGAERLDHAHEHRRPDEFQPRTRTVACASARLCALSAAGAARHRLQSLGRGAGQESTVSLPGVTPDEPTFAPEVSVVIVTWNSRLLMERCLDHLYANRTRRPLEVIVVDNASSDRTAEMIRERFPQVRVQAEQKNHGFAGGTNRGIAMSRSRLVLLLNPDAFVTDPTLIERVMNWLDAHPRYAAAGCQLVHEDGRHQVGDAGYRPTPWSVFVHAFALTWLVPFTRGLYLSRIPRPDRDGAVDVDWICGAFFLIRRSVIDELGVLDERFFMYGEDVEWGCRIRDAGHRLGYLPNLTVTHLQGGTQMVDGEHPPSADRIKGLTAAYGRWYPRRLWVLQTTFFVGFRLRATLYGAIGRLRGDRKLMSKANAMRAYAHYAAEARPPA